MITYQEDTENGIVELTIDGKVTREGFEEVVAKLGPLMEAQGKIGILKHIISFGGMTPSVLWADIRFAFRHLKQVGPIAVVSDKMWIEAWTKLASPFFAADVRFFETDDLDEARTWLKKALAQTKRAKATS